MKNYETVGKILSVLDDCKRLTYQIESMDSEREDMKWDSQTLRDWLKDKAEPNTEDELLNLVKEYKAFLSDKLTDDEKSYFAGRQMEEWILPEYSRKFYNELDNRVELLVDYFRDVVDEPGDEATYLVDVYDLNELFGFTSEKDARKFIDNIDSPWTLFETESDSLDMNEIDAG